MKQSGQKYSYSQQEVAKVVGVNFTIMPEEEIERWAVTEINKYEGAQKEESNFINDRKLGVSSARNQCETCKQNNECPGHFGFIQLKKPIYHINFINTVKQILLCVCHKCGELRGLSIKRDDAGEPSG